MNAIKYDSLKNNKKEKEKDISKKLPYIQKINPVRTLLESSSQSFSSLIPKNNIYFNPRKSQRLIREKNINTKLYKVNDYLSMTTKEANPFNSINSINKTRNKKEITNLKNNRSDIKQDTGKTFNHFYRNSSTGNFNISTTTSQNNIVKLNNILNNNQLKTNKSNTIYNESSLNNNLCNNNDIIKKINDYNLNIIKKSRFFSKTKYINGIKKKIKDSQRHINKSLSTKNISLENTCSTSNKKTINELAVEKLLNKHKKIDEYNKKINEDNNTKKTEEIGIGTDSTKINNAIFYDFIPVILQHMKQKETLDEINKEHENYWLYEKINSIYNKTNNNTTESAKGSLKNKNNILENPIIKYLFLERTLYNLRHTVQFIDIKNREELEQKVIKVMGEEYAKLEKKDSIYDIHDFITRGYELDPKLFVRLKQLQLTKQSQLIFDFENLKKEYIKKEKEKEREIKRSTLPHYKYKGSFFTTNKLDFKTDDNKNKNDDDNESNEKSFSEGGGMFDKILKSNKMPNKVRQFEGLNDDNIKKKPFFINKNINQIYKNRKKESEKDEKEQENDNGVGTLNFDISKYKLANHDINTGISRLAQDLLDDEENEKDKKYNTVKEKEKFNPNRNNLDLSDITHIVKDVQSRDKIKKRHGKQYIKIYSVKKKKPKKKKKPIKEKPEEIEEKKEEPEIDFDLIRSSVIPKPEEPKKEEPKIEIKNKFDYERYKKEKIKEIELDKKSKSKLFAALKRQDVKRVSKKKNSMLNEIYYSSNYQKDSYDKNKQSKKFEKIKRIDEKKFDEESEENIIIQMKKIKKAEKEFEEGEESESYSSDYDDDDDVEELDMSKDMENKGDIIKKNWMENSPKFKNRIIDYNKRRFAISNNSHEMFDDLIKNERIESLNAKMKKLYEKMDKKRKSTDSKRRKKKRPYSFAGVDLASVDEIEKKKKIFLNRIKEDIKYKISEGKYHMIEMDNFKNFEEAMNKFKLKNAKDIRKVKLYINLVEKYLHFYQLELDKKEKEKMDEDRINRFLRNLNQEVYVTLPYVRDVKGRYCHSVDYFKELQELSEYHGF